VSENRRNDQLAESYAAAKAESERIWQVLQTELRAGTPASALSDLESRMWAAMHRLEKARAELSDDACAAWKRFPTKGRRLG
jgi:hypothetical protein